MARKSSYRVRREQEARKAAILQFLGWVGVVVFGIVALPMAALLSVAIHAGKSPEAAEYAARVFRDVANLF